MNAPCRIRKWMQAWGASNNSQRRNDEVRENMIAALFVSIYRVGPATNKTKTDIKNTESFVLSHLFCNSALGKTE